MAKVKPWAKPEYQDLIDQAFDITRSYNQGTASATSTQQMNKTIVMNNFAKVQILGDLLYCLYKFNIYRTSNLK
jgi:hypothetical protein